MSHVIYVVTNSHLIDLFNVEHRELMKGVFEELLYYHTLVYCDNDMCERRISTENALVANILGNDYYFCNHDCQSYGDWSIRYDWRRYHRRNI